MKKTITSIEEFLKSRLAQVRIARLSEIYPETK